MPRRTPANPCTHLGCARTTKDPSRRCHDHQRALAAAGPPLSMFDRMSIGSCLTGETPRIIKGRNGGSFERYVSPEGSVHREGAPAEFEFDASGALIAERWYERNRLDGQSRLHRTDGGPAETTYYPGGGVSSERWLHTGMTGRNDSGPAVIEYRENGRVKTEEWHSGDRPSRLDGPAVITYQERGKKSAEVWTFRGQSGFTSTADIAQRFGDSITAFDLRRTRFAPLVKSEEDAQRVVKILAEGITTEEGVAEVLGGTPVEWVRAYEEGRS